WLPVILLTRVGESFERAAALDEGADDYLNKPFDPQELLARLRAVLRRASGGTAPLSAAGSLRAGALRVILPVRLVLPVWVERQLIPRGVEFLDFLMSPPDAVIARGRLLQSLWGLDALVTARAVDHRIAESHGALGDDASRPVYLENV